MSYTVTTTAGTTLATIADGTVNSSATSLTLIGKNYTGYGIFLNENYVKLLENFSNTSEPNAPLPGQLWYDSGNKVLKLYDGSVWKQVNGAQSTATQPAAVDSTIGDTWWDLNVSQLKAWNGSEWVVVGPISQETPTGTTGPVMDAIIDTDDVSHEAIRFTVGNSVVAIVSKDTEYTPKVGIAGFTSIKPGLNLVSSSSLASARYYGEANVALTLNGLTENNFLRSDQNATTPYTVTVNQLDVGTYHSITATSGSTRLTNQTSNADLELWVKRSSGGFTKAAWINGTSGNLQLANPLTVAYGGTGATSASGARTNLGLGNLATQSSSNISVSGGNIANVRLTSANIVSLTSALAVAYGGTGATTVAGAKTNLGLQNVTNESKATMFTSPAFTGVPTAVTMPAATANTAIATTAFVNTAIASSTILAWNNQTWQALAGSRAANTIYQNTTGAPITVYIRLQMGTSAGNNAFANVGPTSPPTIEVASLHVTHWTSMFTLQFTVPNNFYYRVQGTGITSDIVWNELR